MCVCARCVSDAMVGSVMFLFRSPTVYAVFNHQKRASKSVCMYIDINVDHRPASQRAVGCPMVCFFVTGVICYGYEWGWGFMFALWVLSGCVMAVKQHPTTRRLVCLAQGMHFVQCKPCTDVTCYYGNGKFNNRSHTIFLYFRVLREIQRQGTRANTLVTQTHPRPAALNHPIVKSR